MSDLRSPFSSAFTTTAAADLADTLKVLTDPSRLKILGLLRTHGPLTNMEIERHLGTLAQPTVSHHLRVLDRGGFIATTRAGVSVTRTLVPGRLRELCLLLSPDGAW